MARAKRKTRRLTGQRQRLAAAILLALPLMSGCANDPGPHPELSRLGVFTRVTSRNMCGLGVSPAIGVYEAPAGTAFYRVQMRLINALGAPGWTGEARATGPIIAEGAFPDFPGPCPPERQVFSYRLEVMALAADGRPLAFGWNFFGVLPIGREVATEELIAAHGGDPFPPPPKSVSQSTLIYSPPPGKPFFFAY